MKSERFCRAAGCLLPPPRVPMKKANAFFMGTPNPPPQGEGVVRWCFGNGYCFCSGSIPPPSQGAARSGGGPGRGSSVIYIRLSAHGVCKWDGTRWQRGMRTNPTPALSRTTRELFQSRRGRECMGEWSCYRVSVQSGGASPTLRSSSPAMLSAVSLRILL